MSTKIEVKIQFKDETPETFGTAHILENALKEFHGDSEIAIYCSEIEHQNEEDVYLELSSNRHKNALWQQDLLVRYIREYFEIVEMNCDVWESNVDDSVWLTEEDVLNYESNQ
tara:strand:+ start:461 stop:799 length:339 start_codon:yes stop_codon:yes gene_type:complete